MRMPGCHPRRASSGSCSRPREVLCEVVGEGHLCDRDDTPVRDHDPVVDRVAGVGREVARERSGLVEADTLLDRQRIHDVLSRHHGRRLDGLGLGTVGGGGVGRRAADRHQAVVAREAGTGRQGVGDGAAGRRQVGHQRVGQGDAGQVDVARVGDHDPVVDRVADEGREVAGRERPGPLQAHALGHHQDRRWDTTTVVLSVTGGSVSALSAVAMLTVVPSAAGAL